ncbi:MAG TPA: molybdopterin converting factor subunit 1 [Terriglobales bacterium]|nr:molybdopterin converting factor subunit 1 [Terriglobales bacterium]
MQIRVLFFGQLKDTVSREADTVNLPEMSTVEKLLDMYAAKAPDLKQYFKNMAVAINQEYVDRGAQLKEGDEVALIPPVSGGVDDPAAPAAQRTLITRERIDTAKMTADIRCPEDGAVAVFEGIVRNHSRGRRTLYLNYEAYEGMAEKQLEALATEAMSKFAVRDVRVAHRLGRLEIGETSVAIAVASAHRAAAFDACRWLIDTLKRTVPIWKKEYFEDGAVWADGEPFPEKIAKG